MNDPFLILENSIIPFVPYNPHTTKPNKLHKITAPTCTSRNINKLKEMILYNIDVRERCFLVSLIFLVISRGGTEGGREGR